MRFTPGSFVFIFATLAFSTQSPASDAVHGRVVDGGKGGAAQAGIAAVTVNIEDKDGKLLAAGLTDAAGRYRIASSGPARYAVFDKQGYQGRAARRTIRAGKAAQADVILVAEKRPAAYYRAVAAALGAGAGQEALQYAQAVSALPPAEHTLVSKALGASGATAALASIKRQRPDTSAPVGPDGKRYDTASPFPLHPAPHAPRR